MNNNEMNMVQQDNKFIKYLVLSIIELICCNQITGIIALVFTIVAHSSFQIGNFTDSESKYRISKITLIVGLIVSVILWVMLIAFYLLFGLAIFSLEMM